MTYRQNTTRQLQPCSQPIADVSSSYTDFGRFLTGMLVTTGLALPLLLAHSEIIQPAACWMSMAGGALVYGTIMVYAGAFGGGDDEF
jgi:hypothetical protein